MAKKKELYQGGAILKFDGKKYVFFRWFDKKAEAQKVADGLRDPWKQVRVVTREHGGKKHYGLFVHYVKKRRLTKKQREYGKSLGLIKPYQRVVYGTKLRKVK